MVLIRLTPSIFVLALLVTSMAGLISSCAPREARTSTALGLEADISLRPLTEAERLRDFDSLVHAFSEYYAPLKYKEKKFNFQLLEMARDYRQRVLAAKSDLETLGLMKEFVSRFQDGHVGLNPGPTEIDKYSVPLIIAPFEDQVLVTHISEPKLTSETGIEVGDEVIQVDGRPILSFLPQVLKYEAMGNPVSDRHWVMRILSRPSYTTELRPTQPTVHLKLKKNGTDEIIERTLTWKVEKGETSVERSFTGIDVLKTSYSPALAGVLRASLAHFGSETPFYFSDQLQKSFQFSRLRPSESYLKKYGIQDLSKTPDLFALMYRFEGKVLLLIRMSTYTVSDAKERIAWYKATLDEYGHLADTLIIDQTHNPGGSLDYAQEFVSLFANQRMKGIVNFLKPDRKWLSTLSAGSKDENISTTFKDILELGFQLVETAYDQGLNLTEFPISLSEGDYVKPAADFSFTNKPILMLIDELAGSCGDLVPAVMKENQRATLFGQRTMGLGGNVETVLLLPASQTQVRLTRGFFTVYSADGTYDLENPIENNGVSPHIEYQHTVKDVRAGYIDYVRAFSKAATEL